MIEGITFGSYHFVLEAWYRLGGDLNSIDGVESVIEATEVSMFDGVKLKISLKQRSFMT